MKFVQLFCDNFFATFSLIFTLFFFSLPSLSLSIFPSLLFWTNKKRENTSCHQNYHKWLYKYHYSINDELNCV